MNVLSTFPCRSRAAQLKRGRPTGPGLGSARPTRTGGRSLASAARRLRQAQLRSIKSEFKSRSRGGYPRRASSEVTARSAPAAWAKAAAILMLLPRRSPTMGLSCKRAIFIQMIVRRCQGGIKLFGARKRFKSKRPAETDRVIHSGFLEKGKGKRNSPKKIP